MNRNERRILAAARRQIAVAFCFLLAALPAGAAQQTRFEPVKLADHKSVTACEIGPDGHLYVVSNNMAGGGNHLTRYRLDSDGAYAGKRETVHTWTHAKDTVVGLAIDPASTPQSIVCYASVNRTYYHGFEDEWGGRIERLTLRAGAKPARAEVVIANLPIGFHALNDIFFGGDGKLYINGGSTTSLGGTGRNRSREGENPEKRLSAALLQADVRGIRDAVDVKTSQGGRYDPAAPGAPVRLFATGIRNMYDAAWHPNGRIYGATNMNDVTAQTGSCGQAPNLRDIRLDEWIAIVAEGRYYGHVNHARGECVMLGGNPTKDRDPWEVRQYPVGVRPHKHFAPELMHNITKIGGGSADGTIVYEGPGELHHRVIQCYYGHNGKGRIWSYLLDARGFITGRETLKRPNGADVVIPDCLDLCEHPAGHLFVAKYGVQGKNGANGEVWMLRRADVQAPDATDATAATAATAADVLLVTGGGKLEPGDAAIKRRLEARGLTVDLARDRDPAEGAAGRALVLISTTTSSKAVGQKYRDTPAPVIVWEGYAYDEMGMTGPAAKTDYGYEAGRSSLTLSGQGHPLAAGLSGAVAASSASTFHWGRPGPGARVIATLGDDGKKAAIFAYETGAKMPGGVAPARRMGFFAGGNDPSTPAGFTPAGWALFDAAVSWSIAGGGARNPDADTLRLAARGARAYRQVCIACHGSDGRGGQREQDVRLAPSLVGSPRVTGDASATLRIILHGLTGPVDGKTYSGVMTPFQANDDAWIAGVATYIRGAWGNRAAPVSPADAAAVRKATSKRATSWTVKELR